MNTTPRCTFNAVYDYLILSSVYLKFTDNQFKNYESAFRAKCAIKIETGSYYPISILHSQKTVHRNISE